MFYRCHIVTSVGYYLA